MQTDFVPGQVRILRHLDTHRHWQFSLEELARVSSLFPGDAALVDSLVKRRLVVHDPTTQTYQISPAGQVFAEELFTAPQED